MKRFDFGRCVVASAVAGVLAACGGSQLPTGATSGFAAQRVAPASGAGGALLYVARSTGPLGRTEGIVSIISLPREKVLARITGYGSITGVCSDASGNVWVPNLRHGHWYVDEFARGRTKEINELRAPRPWLWGVCAVNPSNGDLAVMAANIGGANEALIWSGARRGKPAIYPVPFCPVSAAYDDADNLFISGWGCGSTFNAFFGELAKGSSHAVFVNIDRPPGVYGGVQWDGRYIAVADATNGNSAHSVIYRVQVSGQTGKVVGAVKPQGFHVGFFLSSSGFFVLHNGAVIGTAGKQGEHVWAWPYPAGGKPVQSIARYEGITGIAISR
jgi:hypothetical protein